MILLGPTLNSPVSENVHGLSEENENKLKGISLYGLGNDTCPCAEAHALIRVRDYIFDVYRLLEK